MINKIIKTAILIYLLVSIVLLIVVWINSSWLFGFLLGGAMSMLSYFLGILMIELFSRKAKTKSVGFWLGWARVWVQMGLHASVFILVVLTDRIVDGYGFLDGGVNSLYGPINIIAYLAGIGLIAISTLVAHALKRGGKHERIRR